MHEGIFCTSWLFIYLYIFIITYDPFPWLVIFYEILIYLILLWWKSIFVHIWPFVQRCLRAKNPLCVKLSLCKNVPSWKSAHPSKKKLCAYMSLRAKFIFIHVWPVLCLSIFLLFSMRHLHISRVATLPGNLEFDSLGK